MMSRLLYLFAGFCLGFIGFWILATQFPGLLPGTQAGHVSSWHLRSIETDLPPGLEGAKIKYGYLLITKTPEYIGPQASDSTMRYAGNNLTCNNCHLSAGRKIGSGSFVGVYNRFPQFRGRENKTGTLEDRINGCMERSMNGRVMDANSDEMQAMIAYMEWLSEGVPPDQEKIYKGYRSITLPDAEADTVHGKALYRLHCLVCHQADGKGLAIPGRKFSGYVYPPVGGEDSFNNGAGMHRVITAAEFIKSNMPFGATYEDPVLTDDEAYDIAAYINTFDRPVKANLDQDFPDRKLKPVSTPYGPWADDFSPEQHQLGPFQPMFDYYKKTYDIVKTK